MNECQRHRRGSGVKFTTDRLCRMWHCVCQFKSQRASLQDGKAEMQKACETAVGSCTPVDITKHN